MKYDFLGSAYINTSSEELHRSLLSIRHQTLKPNKVILVIDGPLSFNLDEVLKHFQKFLKIQILKLDQNYGLGTALRKGLTLCSSKFVLRFDSDDFNLPKRAEKQIKFMESGNYDISSTWIYEFLNDPENILRIKKIPLSQDNIRKMLPYRNPFNHPSICFKLNQIRNLDGGYRDLPFYEDYDLWIRALNQGLTCGNLKTILVGMKSNNLIKRRIGIKKIFYEAKLFKTFWQNSFYMFLLFIPSFILRMTIRLLPIKFVNFFYSYFLRYKE